MFPCRTLLVPAASSHSCWISFMAFSFGSLGGMPPAARVAAAPLAPRTPAVSFRCGFGRNDVSAETAAKRLHRRQEFLFWDVFFNCSLKKDGMCWCRIVLRQAHCRRLAFRHYLYRSLSTSKPVNGDSIRSKVLGGGEGWFGGGRGNPSPEGFPLPPPIFILFSHITSPSHAPDARR